MKSPLGKKMRSSLRSIGLCTLWSWTLDPVVKPFGSTVKEAGKVVETSEEKDEEFPREKDKEYPREYWTLYPVYLNPYALP